MKRLTREERARRRATVRALRADLRAWRRFRRRAFEAWALLITEEAYGRAEQLRPFVDNADAVLDDVETQLYYLTRKADA